MEFQSISIENFGTIEKVSLALNTPGLTLITGINKDAPKADSNGSGKSLLLDAICWCLWGQTVRGLSGDDVVRRQAGKDCRVELRFTEDERSYVVIRHRKDTRIDKPNDLRLFIDNVEKGKKMKNLQEVIDRIVGYTFDTFSLMMPGAGVVAAELTDAKIKELLEKLLQTEQLTEAYAAARELLKELTQKLATAHATKKLHETELAAIQAELDSLLALEKSFEDDKRTNVSRCAMHVRTLEGKLSALAVVETEVEKTADTLVVLSKEMEQLQEQLVSIQTPGRMKARGLEEQISAAETKAALNRAKIQDLLGEITNLKKLTGTCPTCRTPVDAAHLEKCLAEVTDKLNVVQLFLESNNVQKEVLTTELANHVHFLSFDIALIQDNMSMKKEARRMLESAVSHKRGELASVPTLRAELVEAQRALVAAEQVQHNFRDLFDSKHARVTELTESISNLTKELETLTKEHSRCSFWVEGFSPAGLRSYMLEYIIPILNDRADYYSNVLTAGEMKVTFSTKTALKNGNEKEKFQILVEQKHGGAQYEAISKGEKARADLVIAMALGDLASFRTAKQLPWRFLDEPFENIDDAGNEAVIQLLNEQKARYKTVFVITHKPAFKRLFSQRITMVKEHGISKLEQDTVSE